MKKIIIIDPSNEISLCLKKIPLDKHNIRVITTISNGRDAIEKVKQLQPDLIIMDLILPGMDSLQCIHYIRKLHRNMKILVVDEKHDSLAALTAIERGANGFIAKPLDTDRFSNALEKVFS